MRLNIADRRITKSKFMLINRLNELFFVSLLMEREYIEIEIEKKKKTREKERDRKTSLTAFALARDERFIIEVKIM